MQKKPKVFGEHFTHGICRGILYIIGYFINRKPTNDDNETLWDITQQHDMWFLYVFVQNRGCPKLAMFIGKTIKNRGWEWPMLPHVPGKTWDNGPILFLLTSLRCENGEAP